MSVDEKYFGMAAEEIDAMRQDALLWTDSSHHSEGASDNNDRDAFHSTLREGIRLLFQDSEDSSK